MRTTLVSLSAAVVLAVTAPAAFAAPSVSGPDTSKGLPSSPTAVAVWDMNEAGGATTMIDSSGNGFHGSIGSSIRTGIATDTGLGYKWPFRKPNEPPAEPERLAVVPDNAALDPHSRDISVTFRFKTTNSFGNYLQKGQAKSPGGQVKVQAPKGKVNCMFTGHIQRSAIGSSVPLNDGDWHVVTCRRDAGGTSIYVDGALDKRNRKLSGNIDNDFPWTIGGKYKCDQVRVTCDYFSGEMDYVRIDVG